MRGGPAGGRGEALATNIPARHARRADSSRGPTSWGVWPYALSTNPGGSRARRVARRGVAFGGVRATKSQRAMTGEPRISPHPHTPHPLIPPPSLRSLTHSGTRRVEPPAPSSAGAGPYHLLQHSARACSEHSLPSHQRPSASRPGCAPALGAAPSPVRPARRAPAPARAKRATLPANRLPARGGRAKSARATPRMDGGGSLSLPGQGEDQDLHHHHAHARGTRAGRQFLHPREPEGWHFPHPLRRPEQRPGRGHLGLVQRPRPAVRNRRCSRARARPRRLVHRNAPSETSSATAASSARFEAPVSRGSLPDQ